MAMLLLILSILAVSGIFATVKQNFAGNRALTVTGPRGESGADGLPGAQGIQGASGLDGANGASGTNGLRGLTGPAGPQGPAGPAGVSGAGGDSITFHESGPLGVDEVELATIGPFTLYGKCEIYDVNLSRYRSSINVRSNEDNSMISNHGLNPEGQGYMFSNSNTEELLASSINWNGYNSALAKNNMSSNADFAGVSANNESHYVGRVATLMRNGDNPSATCYWLGSVEEVSL